MMEIERFAELGAFFDRPLQTYSSGMAARLAFALVTAKRPDLLIVDEVLSVGDSYFQHKSFARIRQFREAGSAILLVTHSMGDVRELCDRVLLIDGGTIVRDGPPDEVVDYYNAVIAAKEANQQSVEQRREANGWVVSRSGTFEATVRSMALLDRNTGEPSSAVAVGQPVRLRTIVDVHADLPRLVLGYQLRDRTGHLVWGTNTWHTDQVERDLAANTTVTFDFDFDCDLGQGSYSISPALVSSDTHMDDNYEWTDNLFVFDVVNFDKPHFGGTSHLDGTFRVRREAG